MARFVIKHPRRGYARTVGKEYYYGPYAVKTWTKKIEEARIFHRVPDARKYKGSLAHVYEVSIIEEGLVE